MFKKDDLEEFLFLFSKAETIPFNNWEDALVNNFKALDVPFIDYSKSVIGCHEKLKIEISENLLSLNDDEKLLYLKFVRDKIRLETPEINTHALIDVLKFYNIDTDTLDFNVNIKLKNLLHTSFRIATGKENLIKLRDLNREYYKHLLNNERVKVLNFVNRLIERQPSDLSEEKDNPYPRIFTSPKGFILFEKLKAEFGIGKKLKDYSFVFRKMVQDNLIYSNVKHREYIDFLLTFDIEIDRINTLYEIGNIEYREHIYSGLKATL